jgi:hypothetical protein
MTSSDLGRAKIIACVVGILAFGSLCGYFGNLATKEN